MRRLFSMPAIVGGFDYCLMVRDAGPGQALNQVKQMADVEWKPLPAMWPSPAEWTDVGDFMLLVFTQDGAPIWEVRRRATAGSLRDDRVASGGADTFEAAKSAALFEANAIQETPR